MGRPDQNAGRAAPSAGRASIVTAKFVDLERSRGDRVGFRATVACIERRSVWRPGLGLTLKTPPASASSSRRWCRSDCLSAATKFTVALRRSYFDVAEHLFADERTDPEGRRGGVADRGLALEPVLDRTDVLFREDEAQGVLVHLVEVARAGEPLALFAAHPARRPVEEAFQEQG